MQYLSFCDWLILLSMSLRFIHVVRYGRVSFFLLLFPFLFIYFSFGHSMPFVGS